MNTLTTAIAGTDVQQVEAALDALLTAILAMREESVRPPRGPVQAGTLAVEYVHRLESWTPAQRAAERLLSRPVNIALRDAVRTLGVRLHEMGGVKLMTDACYRVAEADPSTTGRRLSVVDAQWDGIGDWIS